MAQNQPKRQTTVSARASLENSSAPLPYCLVVDGDGAVLSANEFAKSHLPARSGVDSVSLAKLVHPGDWPKVAGWIAEIVSDPAATPGGEFRVVPAAGAERWIRALFVASQWKGERAYSLAGFDISSEVDRMAELRATEVRFLDLLDSATDLIYTTDLEGNFRSVNAAGERVIGYPADQVIKLNIADVIAPEQLPFVRETVARKLTGEPASIYETVLVTRTGDRIDVEISSHLLFSAGRPVGLQGIARVITERKRAAEALRSSQERFAKAFAAGPTAMLLGRLSDGVILDANYSALEFYGYERDELVGRSTIELNIWSSPESRKKVVELLMSQGSLRHQ